MARGAIPGIGGWRAPGFSQRRKDAKKDLGGLGFTTKYTEVTKGIGGEWRAVPYPGFVVLGMLMLGRS